VPGRGTGLALVPAMKNYSYTALSLLVCVTTTGCFSERTIITEGTEDAGNGTQSESAPTTTAPELSDAGPRGSTTTEASTTKPKPPKPSEDPDGGKSTTSDRDPTTTEPKPSETTNEPTTEEDEFFHPTQKNSTGGGGGGPQDADAGANASTSGSWNGGNGTTDEATDTSDDGDYSEEPGSDGELPQAEDIIEEADVIRRDGDTLYALSFSSGLSIIDISDPAHLDLLGRTSFEATASEMYLDGTELVILFQDGGSYDYYYWEDYSSTTTIGVYDVSNPAAIVQVDSATMSGPLLDSRKVGDRLYVAANAECRWCTGNGPTVGSFSLSGSGIEAITTLSVPVSGEGSYSTTIYVNDERLYLVQDSWGYQDSEGNPVPSEVIWGSTGSTSGNGTWADTSAEGTVGTTSGSNAAPIALVGVDAEGPVDAGVAAGDSGTTAAIDGGPNTTGEESTWGGYTYASWSSLQVVDISDEDGAIALGASIRVEGSVHSRWQMDEHDGVLRVVSQDGWSGPAPVVETFAIADSSSFTKLGRLEIELPRPETLQSVRFDGDRGYVVTFEQVDPLFTLDLSDPASPEQLGELEIPGFLFHMMPRGNRLYAIGYDNANEQSLHASVFDVSDLANPVMLDRVNFGGNWGWLGEDQDDIEKSVQMLDEQELMLIPYSGYDYSDDGCGYYRSGVQLIDYTEDDLVLRGSTDAVGYARRAFFHRDHLFGYSDQAVQSFNIADRDNPLAVDVLSLAQSVERVLVVGDKLVRIGDTGLESTFLDVVPVETPNAAIQDSAITLGGTSSCSYVSHFDPVVREGVVYLARQVTSYVDYSAKLELVAISVNGGSGPLKLSETVLVEDSDGLDDVRLLETQNALVVAERQTNYSWREASVSTQGATTMDEYYDVYDGYYEMQRNLRLDVVDTREVGAVLAIKQVDVDQEWLSNGFGSAFDNVDIAGKDGTQQSLIAGGNMVVSQRKVYEEDGSGYRYFAERLDVTNPAEPKWLESVNVPGQTMALAADDVHLVTADEVGVPIDEADCRQSEWDDYVVCYNRMVELSALTLEAERAVRHDRIRLGSNHQGYRLTLDDEAVYVQTETDDADDIEVEAFAYDLEPIGSVAMPSGYLSSWYGTPVVSGSDDEGRFVALLSTDGGALEETGRVRQIQCSTAVFGHGVAYCAAGFDGVKTTPFE
jgi:uncharacterized secreted protein with C-terminal beta-propeller domain